MQIRPYSPRDLDSVVRLSLRAWAPVFVSIEEAMDSDVFYAFYPDWRECQRKAVEAACGNPKMNVWVADDDGTVAGFVAVRIHTDEPPSGGLGEIYMLAVDPECQRRGMGAALTDFALDWLKTAGVSVAMVETGGDPGHAPARRTYENSGFRLLPTARYFKKL